MKINKKYLQKLRNHQEITNDYSFYSIQRIDLLTISISGAGIYVFFEMMKYLQIQEIEFSAIWIKLTGLVFGLSIVINFFSQWLGYYANKSESARVELEIIKEEKNRVLSDSENCEMYDLEKKSEKFSNSTDLFNKISTTLVLIGIISMMVFVIITF